MNQREQIEKWFNQYNGTEPGPRGWFDLEQLLEEANTPTDDAREALAKAVCTIETRSKAASLEEVQAGIQRWTRHLYEADRLIEELADYGLSFHRTVQGEPSDAGEGWFEWFKMPENTTEIAYVHENGEVFDPARGWNPPEFVIAAAEGRVFRLVRAAAATEGGER